VNGAYHLFRLRMELSRARAEMGQALPVPESRSVQVP